MGSHTETRGIPSCMLGHKISGDGNKPDDGIFAEWRWDGHTLRVQNDRYGFYPLFYFCVGQEICVSASIPTLLEQGAPREINRPGLAVFARIGFFVGEDTAFEHIHALPPGATFEWVDGVLRVTGGYLFQKVQDLSRDEAIDRYVSLFKQSIRRRAPLCNDFALTLSGGRDSRHILLELCEIGCPPKFCVTVENFPPYPDESATASFVAAKLNVKHLVVKQKSRFESEFAKNHVTSFCSDEHAWMVALANYLKGKVHCLYDGIGGDVLSAGLFLNRERLDLYESGRLEDLAGVLMRDFGSMNNLNEAVLELFLTRDTYRKLKADVATEHLTSELKKHVDQPNPVSSFFFWNRTRREISLSPYGVFAGTGTALSPYLDCDLFDFLSSLPASFFLDHTFHTDTIARGYPKFADIPYEKDQAMRRVSNHNRIFCGEFLYYLLTCIGKRQELVRSDYLVRRLAYCFATGNYKPWWASVPIGLYFYQLGLALNTPSSLYSAKDSTAGA